MSLDRWRRIIPYRSRELGPRKGGWLFWHHNRRQVGTKWACLCFWHQDAIRVIFCVSWEVEVIWSSTLGEGAEKLLEDEKEDRLGRTTMEMNKLGGGGSQRHEDTTQNW